MDLTVKGRVHYTRKLGLMFLDDARIGNLFINYRLSLGSNQQKTEHP